MTPPHPSLAYEATPPYPTLSDINIKVLLPTLPQHTYLTPPHSTLPYP